MKDYTLLNDVYVDNDIFTTEFACDYEKCKGACCYAEVEDVELDGGSVTPEEALEIRRLRKTLSNFCDAHRAKDVIECPVYRSEGKWFVSLDDQKQCVLLNMKKGSCACKLAHKNGQFPFPIPIACQLYPLYHYEVGGRRYLTIMNTFEDVCECGYVKGKQEHIKLYQFCSEAIIRFFGEDFYNKLSEIAETL